MKPKYHRKDCTCKHCTHLAELKYGWAQHESFGTALRPEQEREETRRSTRSGSLIASEAKAWGKTAGREGVKVADTFLGELGKLI